MDEIVLQAMKKWPNVPALFGWLRLDRRGQWYLRGVRIDHALLTSFIGRNYECDEQGRWFFQNGPQRGYVSLEYTPWILRSEPDGRLLTHTGEAVEAIDGAWIDDNGSLLLRFAKGPALLADSDLPWALERFRRADGSPASEAEVMAALEAPPGEATGLALAYGDRLIPVERILAEQVPAHFGFVQEPSE